LSVSTIPTRDDLIVNANVLGTLNATTLPTVRAVDSVAGTTDAQDYYRFTTTVTSALRVNLSGLDADIDIQLLDVNGAVVTSSVLPFLSFETMARGSLVAGDYFIRIFALPNRNLSNYDLSITLAATSDDSISRAAPMGTPNATTLPLLRQSGVVGGPTDIQDYFSFILAAPTDMRINMTGLSADVDFQLLDQFGKFIVGGANSGTTNENALATGLAAGTYYVRTAAFGTVASAYELSIAIDPTSDDLLSNAFNLGTLTTSTPTVNHAADVAVGTDSRDYYRFTLSTLSDVRINLSGMSSDADVSLEDSFGRIIASSAAGGAGIENLLASGLAAGTYFIRVGAFSGATNYLLTVSTAATSDDLISNATVLPTLTSGTLPTARTSSTAGGSDIQDYYRFDLTTAGSLRFAVSNLTTDLNVQLLDQFGQVIVSGTQSGNTIERVITPDLAVGTYYIRVFQLFGTSSNYNLEITTDFNGDDLIGGRTNLGTLASTSLTGSGSVGGAADIQDYFSITLTSTRNVRFLLTGLTADLDVQVFNSFGNLVGSGTSGSTSTEDFTLNGLLAGVYYIRIFPFLSAISNYSLSVS